MNTPLLRHFVSGLGMLALLCMPTADARVYCCKDAQGQQVCGDVLPPSCANRSYRELNTQGMTVKQIEAPLTEAQRAKRDADARKAAEEERLVQEQRRRDATLINTYATESDIDSARARRVADIEELLRRLREQQQTLTERYAELEKNKARYTGKPIPGGLKDRLDTTAQDMRQLGEHIAAKERDLLETKARFDEDRKRFRELAGPR